MESQATIRYLKATPRKARLVVDVVRGKMVGEALSVLEFGVKKEVAADVAKLIKSAVANMQSKNAEAAIEVDGLKVKEIRVDEGPVMKRFRPRARGRASQIIKRMCHITVTVSN